MEHDVEQHLTKLTVQKYLAENLLGYKVWDPCPVQVVLGHANVGTNNVHLIYHVFQMMGHTLTDLM